MSLISENKDMLHLFLFKLKIKEFQGNMGVLTKMKNLIVCQIKIYNPG